MSNTGEWGNRGKRTWYPGAGNGDGRLLRWGDRRKLRKLASRYQNKTQGLLKTWLEASETGILVSRKRTGDCQCRGSKDEMKWHFEMAVELSGKEVSEIESLVSEVCQEDYWHGRWRTVPTFCNLCRRLMLEIMVKETGIPVLEMQAANCWWGRGLWNCHPGLSIWGLEIFNVGSIEGRPNGILMLDNDNCRIVRVTEGLLIRGLEGREVF